MLPLSSAVARAAEIRVPADVITALPTPSAAQSGGVGGAIQDFYFLALLGAALFAFGIIIYAAMKYTLSAGNVSKQTDARDRIFNALWGLLLLFGAYVMLYAINPDLVNLTLPTLEQPQNVPTFNPSDFPSEGTASCDGSRNQCKNGTAVTALLSGCSIFRTVPAMTWQGTHSANSCHFGGSTCTDGSHAIDIAFSKLPSNRTPQEMGGLVTSCAASLSTPIQCFYEDEGGGNRVAVTAASSPLPSSNHIHCNVANASCGCN